MKPTYGVKVWRDDEWWLGRVIAASDGADPAPLNSLTQARALVRIESMVRDLIATVLDVSEDVFDIEVEYDLPEDVRDSLREAKDARAWLEAAQGLWQEKSILAARALSDRGYSLRETGKLLGISHQRVDQLLEGDVDPEPTNIWAMELEHPPHNGSLSHWTSVDPLHDVDVLLVIRSVTEQPELGRLREAVRALCEDAVERAWRTSSARGTREELRQEVDA